MFHSVCHASRIKHINAVVYLWTFTIQYISDRIQRKVCAWSRTHINVSLRPDSENALKLWARARAMPSDGMNATRRYRISSRQTRLPFVQLIQSEIYRQLVASQSAPQLFIVSEALSKFQLFFDFFLFSFFHFERWKKNSEKIEKKRSTKGDRRKIIHLISNFIVASCNLVHLASKFSHAQNEINFNTGLNSFRIEKGNIYSTKWTGEIIECKTE